MFLIIAVNVYLGDDTATIKAAASLASPSVPAPGIAAIPANDAKGAASGS
jgi:hypothetical protein